MHRKPIQRSVYGFNPGWRFLKGDCEGGEQPDWDDSGWQGVDLPHGLEILPVNASGSINYQGPAWYRKRFTLPESVDDRRVFLHFHAIMGVATVWVNGVRVCEHLGGYLPIHVDIRDQLRDGDNVVALRCDNQNNPDVPPGKPQEVLDFSYFGGIYRDVELILCPAAYLTDANDPRFDTGGVHFRTLRATEEEASFSCRVGCFSDEAVDQAELELRLISAGQEEVYRQTQSIPLSAGEAGTAFFEGKVPRPDLWSPDEPALYRVECRLSVADRIEDQTSFFTGLRTIECAGRDGLLLNGKPFGDKLFGVNRHQDYPHLGNAIGALLHERDAVKFHKAGLNFVRSAHYPQDTAFMDACDRLGILVIVATPGWQFFRSEGPFIDRVMSDIRQMVRRDRNRPSVFLWEPILNETNYDEAFALRAFATVREEDPDRPSAADAGTPGSEACEVSYCARLRDGEERPVVTREWGDSPDDWRNQLGRARQAYELGEHAQTVQVRHYMAVEDWPDPGSTNLASIFHRPAQHLGGALWAGIECQRGYHPDYFAGGILSLYREEKFSYYLFQSQRGPDRRVPPMVFIANEMMPSSSQDVLVFTNCEEVVLRLDGEEVGRQRPAPTEMGLPHPPLCFPQAYTWVRTLDRKKDRPHLLAEGFVGGEKVCEHRVCRPGRKHRLSIRADFEGITPRAGGEVLPFFVDVLDEHGTRFPQADEWIEVEVRGGGTLIGDRCDVFLNPVKARCGTAPVLVKTGPAPGRITLAARVKYPGVHTPSPDVYHVETSPAGAPLCFDPVYAAESAKTGPETAVGNSGAPGDWVEALAEVERDQQDFADTTARPPVV
ncbi:MAG: glycoside hydrolase family 2 protein [Verrucomicrobia bacterium]|nr:glycoside hydrolase family 2 protein [Verrucomicrobiota bacterium]MCH8529032.1 glycoside hydrolase family 2 protein [Kiritimatiellia bacterium]